MSSTNTAFIANSDSTEATAEHRIISKRGAVDNRLKIIIEYEYCGHQGQRRRALRDKFRNSNKNHASEKSWSSWPIANLKPRF